MSVLAKSTTLYSSE